MAKLDSTKLHTPINHEEGGNSKKAALTRFISEAEKRTGAPSKTVTFRFPNEYIELLENVANEFGVNRINVLKAALQMFNDADDNQKNVYFVKTIK
ncbi:hypothetical protein CKG00_18385 [Morganella morganii]|uniref:CopG family transcriptional regulator n=1 Tax=Morganella morganii TaxID=582 RepID=A0A433ZPP8_MORMO|nr:hypothetical protein [Morganella morganii]RUT64101.1 hypothetical protein CKG00_18385 [Morganella morganii]